MSNHYPDWLQTRIANRGRTLATDGARVSFSIITPIYERTDVEYFEQTWESLRLQTCANFEWVVLAQGPAPPLLEAYLQQLQAEPNVRVYRLADNLGIIGGMRYCLERARNDYILPVDGDDLLTVDALQLLTSYIRRHDCPSFLYSDDDTLSDGVPVTPFLRPEWDPVLALSCSYVWHILAIRRDRALAVDLYQDNRANWCHDWDTVLRLAAAGDSIVHVPEVLYHWRAHSSSSTNRADPESGSLASQRFVLQREIDRRGDPVLFEVKEFPIFRGGAPEYWLRRLRKEAPAIDVLVFGACGTRMVASVGALLRKSGFRFASVHFVGAELSLGDRRRISDLIGADSSQDRVHVWPTAGPRQLADIVSRGAAAGSSPLPDYVAVCSERVRLEGDEWPWECDGLFRLHASLNIVAGRVLGPDRKVLAGAEIFGFDGISGCPDAGRDSNYPGDFALALKHRSISAPYSELFVARAAFLRECAHDFPPQASWEGLGSWLGALAYRRQLSVAVSPLFTGMLPSDTHRFHMGKEEATCFLDAFGSLLPDTRWYSPLFGWSKESAPYRFHAAASS
jgi:hypothetical protein